MFSAYKMLKSVHVYLKTVFSFLFYIFKLNCFTWHYYKQKLATIYYGFAYGNKLSKSLKMMVLYIGLSNLGLYKLFDQNLLVDNENPKLLLSN